MKQKFDPTQAVVGFIATFFGFSQAQRTWSAPKDSEDITLSRYLPRYTLVGPKRRLYDVATVLSSTVQNGGLVRSTTI